MEKTNLITKKKLLECLDFVDVVLDKMILYVKKNPDEQYLKDLDESKNNLKNLRKSVENEEKNHKS